MSSKRFLIMVLSAVLLLAACQRSATGPISDVILVEETETSDATEGPANTDTPVPLDTTAPEPEDDATVAPEETEEPADTAEPPAPTPQPLEPTAIPTVESGVIGEVWNLADVRYGLHEGFLRVVIEMAEDRTTLPYYVIKEVENATVPFPTGPDASWGQSRIDLVVSDLYAYDSPVYGSLPFIIENNPVVTKIGKYPTFDDAMLGFSIGLKNPAEFTTAELTSPVRIVIDIQY